MIQHVDEGVHVNASVGAFVSLGACELAQVRPPFLDTNRSSELSMMKHVSASSQAKPLRWSGSRTKVLPPTSLGVIGPKAVQMDPPSTVVATCSRASADVSYRTQHRPDQIHVI